MLEAAMGAVRGEGDQQEENTGEKGREGLAIQKMLPRRWIAVIDGFYQGSDPNRRSLHGMSVPVAPPP